MYAAETGKPAARAHGISNMYWLIGLLLVTTSASTTTTASADSNAGLLLTDFTADSTDMGWYVVNDNVMGGRSDGDFEQEDGVLKFTGRTNTNGGGFSSIRTKPMELALSDHSGVQLRVKGDGRRYTDGSQGNDVAVVPYDLQSEPFVARQSAPVLQHGEKVLHADITTGFQFSPGQRRPLEQAIRFYVPLQDIAEHKACVDGAYVIHVPRVRVLANYDTLLAGNTLIIYRPPAHSRRTLKRNEWR